jgi:hypothetical protein
MSTAHAPRPLNVPRRFAAGTGLALLAVVLTAASPAGAVLVPGGGSPRTDCYAEFDVSGVPAPGAGSTVQCTDGDPACDGDGVCDDTCHFQVALCANQSNLAPACTPTPLGSIGARGRAKRLGLASPAGDSACGAFLDVAVPVRAKRSKKRPGVLTLRAAAASAAPRRSDRDHVRLTCLPCGTAAAVATACPANPAGADAPNQLALTVAASGTDLDNGWTGISHNFGLVGSPTVRLCLSGCDTDRKPTCAAHGETGAGSLNGATFGPPLPLLAAGIPVCAVNRYQGTPIDGTTNLATGDIDATMNLLTDVYLTTEDAICPRCTGIAVGARGVCDGGAAAGRACIVEGLVDDASGGKPYGLSSTCVPAGAAVGTLELGIPLTTATAALQGPKPCGGSGGVAVQDDRCAGGGCSSSCTGSACVARTADGECIDAKGGISQLCCDADTTRPCFPTAAGSGGRLERVGASGSPVPSWPAPAYPKTAPATLVGTFCEPATGSTTLNITTGLPGPAALVMPVTACWGTPEAACR